MKLANKASGQKTAPASSSINFGNPADACICDPIFRQQFQPRQPAFMIGFFTILAALSFEMFGGYEPCELCLLERMPYYIGLPVLAVTIGVWKQISPLVRLGLTLIVAAIFGSLSGAHILASITPASSGKSGLVPQLAPVPAKRLIFLL